MAPLPEQRLTPFLRPFTNVGVDYLGPIDIINARRHEKRYVAVFTCLVTRAVHLEVAYSLSTESCIMAIKRFVCRRGPPADIYSDNGTNFQGASNELKRQMKELNLTCAATFTDTHTKWIFNPPSAPHLGTTGPKR
uniref:Integrase catalytic domain-containing protein n=1 Tax=Anopheles gambiae TaxID=7165 RepID=A0A0E4C795_ANOGA